MKRVLVAGLLVAVVLLFAGCTAGPNAMKNAENQEGEVAGFFQGLWHGIISPVTFIISLFTDDVSIYEVRNNGGWYNFGFIVGAMIIFGGGGNGACRTSGSRSS
jgi:uncharacterized spore protein YtfJ